MLLLPAFLAAAAVRQFLRARQPIHCKFLCFAPSRPNVVAHFNILCMCINCAIRFAPSTLSSSIFGGISFGTTYFVLAIPSSTTFSISVSRGGAQLTLAVGRDANFRSRKQSFVSYLFRLRQHERATTRNFHKQLFFVGISSVCRSAGHQRLFQGEMRRRLCFSCSR
jgi:hypothetical protein